MQLVGLGMAGNGLWGLFEAFLIPSQPAAWIGIGLDILVGAGSVVYAERIVSRAGYRESDPGAEQKETESLTLWLQVFGILCAAFAAITLVLLLFFPHKASSPRSLFFLLIPSLALVSGLIFLTGAARIARWLIRIRVK